MDLPKRPIFLAGFGWAGVASLLTWAIPVISGAPLSTNAIELLFGVAITAGIGHAIYTESRQHPSMLSVVFAVAAALFSTLELFSVGF